jgi:hypothetical protein
MDADKPSREELFALAWEKPATEVARELGISDVALGKLCHRLQVPKPPCGYWARVKSGKSHRRPQLGTFKDSPAGGLTNKANFHRNCSLT